MESGTVWFTGLSGAGKSTVAETLKVLLDKTGVGTVILDSDDVRQGLSSDLSFSEIDRRENIRRVGEVALLLSQAGHLCLVPVISPYSDGRGAVRSRHESVGVPFVEVYVATPLDVCEERDPKGLYARARRGEVEEFTGITSPYEVPERPDLVLETSSEPPEESAARVLERLRALGLV